MMNANMEKLVEIMTRDQECENAYDCGRETNDPVMMESARSEHQALMAELEAKGQDWFEMLRLLEEQEERENMMVDFHDCIWEKKIPGIVAMLRKFGITRFTISGGWTSMNETIWAFTHNGCKLAGMMQINEGKHFGKEEFDTVPAFVLEIE